MKVVIVEDNKQSREQLAKMLAKYQPELEVVGFGENVEEGIHQISTWTPDLVFLDVEMPGGSGFDVLKETSVSKFNVVFTTGYEKYAISAIKFGALDFILKPVSEKELGLAVEKARNKKNSDISPQQFEVLMDALKSISGKTLPKRLVLSTSKGKELIEIEDIIRLRASGNYTEFHLNNPTRKIVTSMNIGAYEEQFSLTNQIIRVHRAHMVNMEYVNSYLNADGGSLLLKNGDQIEVSQKYKDGLFDALKAY